MTDTEPAPLCSVLMPFGSKQVPGGRGVIDFDALYGRAVEPGIRDAGMIPVREEAKAPGGPLHRALFERLMLCDLAVVDLTTASANIFYALGIRNAIRPQTTLPIFADHAPVELDLTPVRALEYALDSTGDFSDALAAGLRAELAARLGELRAHRWIRSTAFR